MEKVLVIEPFSVDSHKLLVDFLEDRFETVVFALPAQKWHWKARTAALYFAQMIPSNQELQCRTLFASSVLNLAELVAMRPDLAGMKKVLYFHENQLVYPVRKQQERDFQYGYNQIISSLVADVVIFNSSYNMSSFLSSIPSFLNLIPDHRPQNIPQQITPKCHVIYLPLPIISFPQDAICSLKKVQTYKAQLQEEQGKSSRGGVSSKGDSYSPVKSKTIETSSVTIKPSHIKDDSLKLADEDFISNMQKTNSENLHQERESCENENHQAFLNPEEIFLKDKTVGGHICSDISSTHSSPREGKRSQFLHIVWPHRWEHDKNPEMFFSVLLQLQEEGYDFRLSVLGGQFSKVPAIFADAKRQLASKIADWGYQPSKDCYYSILRESDVVVSTAYHEFLGLAMLEAAFLGCHPLCPNRLAYPEIFPKSCLYNTQQQLFKKLREFCRRPWLAKEKFPNIDFSRFSQDCLLPKYEAILKPSNTN